MTDTPHDGPKKRISVRIPPAQLVVLEQAVEEDDLDSESEGVREAAEQFVNDVHPDWLDESTEFDFEFNDYQGPFEKMDVRLEPETLAAFDAAVETNVLPNRSEGLRLAVRRYLDDHPGWRNRADDPDLSSGSVPFLSSVDGGEA